MLTAKCGECGRPAVITEADRDAGAEVYCSERCANGFRKPVDAPLTCYLCGEPCESVDHGRHLHCEQEENARIRAAEEAFAADAEEMDTAGNGE